MTDPRNDPEDHQGHEHHFHHGSHEDHGRVPVVSDPAKHHGHAGHDAHEGHSAERFRDRFWLSAILMLPVVFWSDHIQELLRYEAPVLPGSD